MRSALLFVSMLAMGAPRLAQAQVAIVFVDGTRMEVESYEVKEGIVLLKTKEGKLQSVPRSYVNLVATEQLNRGGASAPPPAATASPRTAPAPRSAQPPTLPTESVEPEPTVPEPTPPAPAPPAPPRAAPPSPNLAASPPPVWSNEELQVSLVVPSASWTIEDMPPSFDVAVALSSERTEARATLALIRQKIRGERDFRDVVRNIETSISQAPGFRSIRNAAMELEPYKAHEFRFVKNVGFVPVYNRLVVFYSRDLAYVLSLTCPEGRQNDNEAEFEAFVRGLVIKKARNDLTF